jgi:type IV secretion system protein VirB6
MAGSIKVFSTFQDAILAPFASNLEGVVTALSGKVGPVFTLAMTIYVIWEGYNISLGRHHEMMGDFVRKLMKLGFIAAFVMNADVYKTYVVDIAVNAGPDFVSQLVTAYKVPDANAFDGLANDVLAAVAEQWRGTSWSPGAMARAVVLSIILIVVALFAITLAFLYTTVIKACVYMVLLLGPVFIATLLFEATKSFFNNFVSTIVTLIVHQVLIAAMMGLLVETARKQMAGGGKDPHELIFVFFFLWFVIPGLIAVANRLGGGANWANRGDSRLGHTGMPGASNAPPGMEAAGGAGSGAGSNGMPAGPRGRIGDTIGGLRAGAGTATPAVEPVIAQAAGIATVGRDGAPAPVQTNQRSSGSALPAGTSVPFGSIASDGNDAGQMSAMAGALSATGVTVNSTASPSRPAVNAYASTLTEASMAEQRSFQTELGEALGGIGRAGARGGDVAIATASSAGFAANDGGGPGRGAAAGVEVAGGPDDTSLERGGDHAGFADQVVSDRAEAPTGGRGGDVTGIPALAAAASAVGDGEPEMPSYLKLM